ncbi:MAG: hypothetical protein IJW70_04885 [Clostridia bacterium]|nr:hypothetical protein [Clostridia bacterium]
MSNQYQQCVKTLAEREKLSAIIWLVIGIIQCCTFAGIVCGVYNIYSAICRFKQAKLVLTPYPGLVKSYDNWMTSIIIGLVLNLILGGVVGVACSIFDMIGIRGYVLEHKDEFEALEADPTLAN